jgi:Ca2+-binding EF-hand superfamily protein
MGLCYSKKDVGLKLNSTKRHAPSEVEANAKRQRMELNSYFDRFDRDRDGQLDREDIARMMEEIQVSKRGGQSIEEMVDNFMSQIDTNRNGMISKE